MGRSPFVQQLASHMIGGLPYGLDWDRDYYVSLAIRMRLIYWPMTVFLIHPLVIFVILRNTKMTTDFKAANIFHMILLISFDIYNCLLYQMYPLAPLPVILCTGLLCKGAVDGKTLLIIFSVFTVAVCVPYLFLIMRMHQRMIPSDSPLKAKTSVQLIAMVTLTAILVSNNFGFHYWAIDIPMKNRIIETPDVIWARNFTSNFLVLGESIGDIGPFGKELALLLVSIAIIFTFYVFLSYHAIYKVRMQFSRTRSKTYQAQLRLVYSLIVQSSSIAVFFISPLIILFVGLTAYNDTWGIPGWIIGQCRATFLLMYSMFSLGHSTALLTNEPWLQQAVLKIFKKNEPAVTLSIVQTQETAR